MTTVLRVGSATHTGQVRSANEDAKLTMDNRRLWAVADGMGGHNAGEVAAALAVETIERNVTDPSQASLVAAVELANRTIHDRAAEDPELAGMGTTLCAVAVIDADDGGEEIVWVNVGDSRVYLFRDDTLFQLSSDHTLVEDLRRDGQLTAEEAATHPKRNIITRALGIDAKVQVDSKRLMTLVDDRFLLCSDGLYGEVTDDQISATLRRLADPREAADELIRQANEHGGRDNITCVVVDVVDDNGRAAAAAEAAAADAERARIRAAEAAAAAGIDEDATTQTLPPADHLAPDGEPDMAGFTTPAPPAAAGAPDAADDDLPFGRGTEDVFADLDRARGKHITWRVLVFLLALVLVVGVALGAVGWYAKRSYFVGFANSEVVVYQGQPGGLLIFDPVVKIRTGVTRADLTPDEIDTVANNRLQGSSLATVRTSANNLKTAVQAREDAATTTTTTSTTTTTTTAPAKTTTTTP